MTSVEPKNKRNIEEVDESLRSLAAAHESANEEQRNKRRRRQYAPMTQYPETPETSQFDAQGNVLELTPSGFIKKITLRNFMCHEHFELELGPRLNFIVGANGSGKSAILTAITIGLGAKASDTNRGSSLKSLIREGCHQAKITLHLENSKHGAYNQGTFGKEIIIERLLKRDGSATFSLRSETGAEISNKKRDVQAVVDYFSVPINNPMCFLSQDAARSFLTASTSHDKYGHFMKGTLLQEITNSLEQAREINNRAQENMALHLQNLKGLKEEYEDAKKLLRELNKTTDLTQRKRLLQGKSLWIDVSQNEGQKNKLKDQVKGFEQEITQLTKRISSRQERIERFTADSNAQEREIENKVTGVAARESEHQEARDLLQEVRSRYEDEKHKIQNVEEQIDGCEATLKTLDKTVRRLENELRIEMGGDREQMKIDICGLETRNKELQETLHSLMEKKQELENDERKVIREREHHVRNAQHSIQSKKNELRQVATGESSFLTTIDSKLPRLLQELEARSHEFKSVPIGPLGSFISVKDGFQKWAPFIQTVLSSALNTFVVRDQKDSQLFREIMRSCGIRRNIPVATYKVSRFDYSGGKANCDFPTIADSLDFLKPEVEHILVDFVKIEKYLLIEDKNQARRVLKQLPGPPKIALSLRDNRFGYKITGGYDLDSVRYQNRLILKVGSSEEEGRRYLEQVISQEELELQKIKNGYDERLSEIQSGLASLIRKTKDIKLNIGQNNDKIGTLEIDIGKFVNAGSLESKKNERKRQEEVIASYKTAKEELSIKIEKIALETLPLKEKYDSTRTALLENREELQQLKDDFENRHSKIERYKDEMKYLEQKKVSYKNSVQQIVENIEILERGIESQISYANEFCSKEQAEDPDLPSNQDEIKKELEKISRMIIRAENDVGITQQKAVELFEESRGKYKEGHEKYVEIDRALEMLYKSIQVRLQNLQAAQRTTCLDADLDFRASLRVRRFSGNLSFITGSKRLEIYILTPDDDKARNVDTLSGGEKSFSQMALLLATWKPMRSRIIALDEFDVFMDQVNRRIGTSLILKKLKDNSRTQTIIITPQDIGNIADIDSEGVNIHKIRDPQRQNNSNYYA